MVAVVVAVDAQPRTSAVVLVAEQAGPVRTATQPALVVDCRDHKRWASACLVAPVRDRRTPALLVAVRNMVVHLAVVARQLRRSLRKVAALSMAAVAAVAVVVALLVILRLLVPLEERPDT